MLVENRKDVHYKRGGALFLAGVLTGAALGGGVVAARLNPTVRPPAGPLPATTATRVSSPVRPVVRHVRPPAEAKSQPHPAHRQPHAKRLSQPRATISLYEHTTSSPRLRLQGCSAAKRG